MSSGSGFLGPPGWTPQTLNPDIGAWEVHGLPLPSPSLSRLGSHLAHLAASNPGTAAYAAAAAAWVCMHAQAAYNTAEALKQLTDTAVKWEVGKEPYHRLALPPHVMDLLLQQQQQGEEGEGGEELEEEGAGAVVAAVAAAMAVKVTYVKAKQPAAAAAAAAGGGGDEQQELEGGKKGGGKKSAGKKRPAADAVAIADQQQQQTQGGTTARSSSVASSSKRQKTGAAASAAAASAAGGAAAEGQAVQELVAVERQFRPLWVPVQEFPDPQGELAQAMKTVKTDYDTTYRTVSGFVPPGRGVYAGSLCNKWQIHPRLFSTHNPLPPQPT